MLKHVFRKGPKNMRKSAATCKGGRGRQRVTSTKTAAVETVEEESSGSEGTSARSDQVRTEDVEKHKRYIKHQLSVNLMLFNVILPV